MLTKRPYVAIQVTLASNAATYNLSDLVDAVIAAETGIATNGCAPRAGREISIQNDPSNTGSIFIGDGKLVAGASQPGRCGYVLGIGGSRQYGTGDIASVDIGQLYASPKVNGAVLNIEIMVG